MTVALVPLFVVDVDVSGFEEGVEGRVPNAGDELRLGREVALEEDWVDPARAACKRF